MCQSYIPAPPVVNQGYRPSTEITALQVLCCVTTPAPLVLQLIKAVLAIGTVAVKLADGLELIVGVGHQYGVIPAFNWVSVVKVQVLLALCLFSCQAFHRGWLGLGWAAHHHNPAGM